MLADVLLVELKLRNQLDAFAEATRRDDILASACQVRAPLTRYVLEDDGWREDRDHEGR